MKFSLDEIISYTSNLHDMGLRIPDSSTPLPAFVADIVAQLTPGEGAKINLISVHTHHVDPDFRPVLVLRMDDEQQITRELRLPEEGREDR